MNLQKLSEPLSDDNIEWRVGRCGKKNDGSIWCKALAYMTSRGVMDRLDEVCGPENWQDEYKPGPDGGVICGISIFANDRWVTKWDGADNTDIESVKGGLSDSFKRAAVKWGIGRYLYRLDEAFSETSLQRIDGWNYQPADKNGKYPAFYWSPPPLPQWAQAGTQQKSSPKKNEPPPPPETQTEIPAASEKITRPMTAEQVKASLTARAAKYADRNMTDKQNKLFPVVYLSLFLDDNERHAATEWLFGQPSTKDMTDAQKLAVIDWLSLEKQTDGKQIPSKDAMQEKTNVILAALKDQGQSEMEL